MQIHNPNCYNIKNHIPSDIKYYIFQNSLKYTTLNIIFSYVASKLPFTYKALMSYVLI